MGANREIPKRPLGKTGELVTIFGLGGEGVLRTHGRTSEAVAVIDRALDQGVNYYDSAPAYAACLDYLGEALGARRSEVFLASKTHDRTRDGSLRLLDETLRRLRTDRLDLWQLHDLRTSADLAAVFGQGGALQALLEAREQGRVRYLGITGHHDPDLLLEAMRRFEFDTVLLALNCADRVRLPFLDAVLPEAAARKIGAIAMKVYAQGTLLHGSGVTDREALGYVLSAEGVSTAIIGCSAPVEVDRNAEIARAFEALDQSALRNLEQRVAPDAAAFTAYKKSPLISLE